MSNDKSIPQLRKDITDTQQKLHAAEAEIKRLRSLPPTIVEKLVEKPMQVVKVVERVSDSPDLVKAHKDAIKEIERLTAELKKKPKTKTVVKQADTIIEYRDVIKEVPKQVIKTVTIEKDSQTTIDALSECRAAIKQLKAELDAARNRITIREKIVEVPVIEYRDNPKHIEMIRKLRGK